MPKVEKPEDVKPEGNPPPAPPPPTVADHRMTLNAIKDDLVSLGAMARAEADHLFGPIFVHLKGL